MAEKAQVGDLIRVVNAVDAYGAYENGDILEVIGRFEVGDGDGVEVKETGLVGDTMLLYDREYVIHRKAGEEDAPCDDFIVDGCLFEYQDGSVRRAERVTDDWIYADDGKRYKRMFANRVTDVMTTKSYELMEETKAFDESFAKDCETQADRIRRAGTELTELLVRKNHDYGDSFAKQYEKYGLMSALIRMDDKMRRLETLLGGTDAQVDESIKDSLLDLAGYALLASVEANKQGGR